MTNAGQVSVATTAIDRPPGFLLNPLKWAAQPMMALLQDQPLYLADLIHLTRTRMHLIGIALAHVGGGRSAELSEILFRGSADMILDQTVGDRSPGLKRAVSVMPSFMMEAESYRGLVKLLSDPNAARLIHHTSEIRDSTIRAMSDVPAALRPVVFSVHANIGEMSFFFRRTAVWSQSGAVG